MRRLVSLFLLIALLVGEARAQGSLTLVLEPGTARPGTVVTGTVRWQGPLPAEGGVVSLIHGSAVSTPVSVRILPQQRFATFAITVLPGAPTDVLVQAKYGGEVAYARLAVVAAPTPQADKKRAPSGFTSYVETPARGTPADLRTRNLIESGLGQYVSEKGGISLRDPNNVDQWTLTTFKIIDVSVLDATHALARAEFAARSATAVKPIVLQFELQPKGQYWAVTSYKILGVR